MRLRPQRLKGIPNLFGWVLMRDKPILSSSMSIVTTSLFNIENLETKGFFISFWL